MSRTLFWYVFKDLLRIFLLASGALAGIMSFGGLLRPVYEHGLDAGQVVKMLGYFMPAMTTYSLPIAALFATTMVYGRLSADNEITACRAAGIPLGIFGLALPAVVMGLVIALVSLLCLCFVVPVFWLKIERVIYSNIAELVASQIERTHQIRFEHAASPVTVFAQSAQVRPPDPARPREQVVRLVAPMIVTYDTPDRANLPKPPVPEEFYTARTATAYIRQGEEDEADVTLFASLDSGMRFPRRPGASQRQNVQVSIGSTNFGPIVLPSPVRENTKFMDIVRLRRLLDRPELSRRVRETLGNFILVEQQETFLHDLRERLTSSPQGGTVALDAGAEQYLLRAGPGATAEVKKGRLILLAPEGAPPLRLVRRAGGQDALDVEAREVRVRTFADSSARRVDVNVEMIDCVVGSGGERAPRPNFDQHFAVPMPAELVAIEDRTARDYLDSASVPQQQKQRLLRDVYKIHNGIVSELNARASFGVSCFILVLVGCALGMMFRSGNFLSAFAVSVVPALLTIALVVTGQHTCENIPWNIRPGEWTNPLHAGLFIIWSGNAAVLAIATVLLWRLQRQ